MQPVEWNDPKEARRFQILVAEDSPTQAARIEATLTDDRWDVTIVENGRIALEEARRTPPSLVITDIVMPEMDGYALCRAIREEPTLAGVPVILLTRLSDPADIARGLEVGADNFIRKPFRPQYLRDRVEYILHAIEVRRQERISTGLEIELGGRRYFINNDRQQILDLLISTYEQSIELNAELRLRQDELERCNRRLAGLADLAQRLNLSASEREAAKVTLDCALQLPDVLGGWIGVGDGTGGTRLLASRNLPPHVRDEIENPPPLEGGASPGGCALRRFGADGTRKPSRYVAAPLSEGGAVRGRLCLFGPGEGDIPDVEWETLGAIGHQVAAALERIRLQADLRRRLQESTANLSVEHDARNQAERALERTEHMFEALVETAPDGIILIGADGTIGYANRRAEAMLGYPAGGMRTLPWAALGEEAGAALLHGRDGYANADGDDADNERLVAMARKDGTTLPVAVTLSPYGAPDRREMICIVRDMTERLRLEQILQQTQRLEAIGQLTGGVAHDFNNLLGVIIGNLDLLEPATQKDPDMQRRVATALRAALNGAELTKRLLAFARKQPLSPRPVRLADALKDVEGLLDRALKGDAELKLFIPPLPSVVMIDQGGLDNVILNMAINARDAMPEGGVFTLELQEVELDARYVAENGGGFAPGRYARLSVSDTGGGMTPEVLDRAFDPFFTTKEKGKGTGLGLAMAHGFVKQSGGHIKAYSEPGQGTSFHIYLPVVNETAAPAVGASDAEETADGRGRILVVDDEADLAEVAVAYLTSLGYEAEAVASGEEALQALQRGASYDLVLTDMVMPGGMDGIELHRRAAREWPTLRFLYASGFSNGALVAKKGGAMAARLVAKPFRKEDLSEAVRATLLAPPHPYKESTNA